jgi:predicted nucleic acid-binding Zn finger protein
MSASGRVGGLLTNDSCAECLKEGSLRSAEAGNCSLWWYVGAARDMVLSTDFCS